MVVGVVRESGTKWQRVATGGKLDAHQVKVAEVIVAQGRRLAADHPLGRAAQLLQDPGAAGSIAGVGEATTDRRWRIAPGGEHEQAPARLQVAAQRIDRPAMGAERVDALHGPAEAAAGLLEGGAVRQEPDLGDGNMLQQKTADTVPER